VVQFRTSPPQPILPTAAGQLQQWRAQLQIQPASLRGVVTGFVLSDPTGRLRGVDFQHAE
jgi:hypothetical protein